MSQYIPEQYFSSRAFRHIGKIRSSAITTEDNFQSAEESRNKERTYLPWSRNANCYDYENSIDISKNRRCKAKARKTSLPRNTPTPFSDHLFLRNIGDCAIPRARANLSVINHANAARRIVTVISANAKKIFPST